MSRDTEALQAALDRIPRPPWPADWPCHDLACRHRRDQHAEPIVEDGHCTGQRCLCGGWDPLTPEQWMVANTAYRIGLRSTNG